jgi:hypothetical protein
MVASGFARYPTIQLLGPHNDPKPIAQRNPYSIEIVIDSSEYVVGGGIRENRFLLTAIHRPRPQRDEERFLLRR